MSESNEYTYVPLSAVEGIPSATMKAIMAEFEKLDAAYAALKRLAEPLSKAARATGKIPATHEIVFQRSRFGGTPEMRIGPMRASKAPAKRFAL